MKNKAIFILPKVLLAVGFTWLIAFLGPASAAQVTLQWDANNPVPDGYRLFQRLAGDAYDYAAPAWTGTANTCVITDLTPGVSYYFVLRAFQGSDVSGDSNEVQYTPAVDPNLDSDGDGWIDTLDAFPHDPQEWLDTDHDGIGNNADADDDNDGMPDVWETQYGLNPLVNDASGDLDGDGISNLGEYLQGSDPSMNPHNLQPDKPLLSQPANGALGISLTPVLMTEAFADPDGDGHERTCYQISTTSDFSSLVFERTFTQHLTSLRIPELILDPETTYYWRVKFYDDHNGGSEWSEYFHFETIDSATAGDSNGNGIIDTQEIDLTSDIDGDGTPDALQSGLQEVVTINADNLQMAVKRTDTDMQMAGMQALDLADLPAAVNQPDHLDGLISFKLLLPNGESTATVRIFFSQPAPADAKWYKFDPDAGWTDYADAVFSPDHRSVILTLEDGGTGDQDGVRNGIIVDPSGLGYSSAASDSSTYLPANASGAGCFIGTLSIPGWGNWEWGILLVLLSAIIPLLGKTHFLRQPRKREE
jgi:chitinase